MNTAVLQHICVSASMVCSRGMARQQWRVTAHWVVRVAPAMGHGEHATAPVPTLNSKPKLSHPNQESAVRCWRCLLMPDWCALCECRRFVSGTQHGKDSAELGLPVRESRLSRWSADALPQWTIKANAWCKTSHPAELPLLHLWQQQQAPSGLVLRLNQSAPTITAGDYVANLRF